MNNKKKFHLPPSLVAIDAVGAMLVAWGFYLYISDEGGLLYIAAGFLLMAPLMVHLLNFTRGSAQTDKEN